MHFRRYFEIGKNTRCSGVNNVFCKAFVKKQEMEILVPLKDYHSIQSTTKPT